jgi:predicted dehydrogenase
MVGLDTSHVIAFTKILNDETGPHTLPGVRIVAAYPSFSEDVESSYSRVEGYTQDLKENWGLEIVEDIPSLCSKVDAVLLESVDGRRHLPEYRQIAECGKPCFIDKPMTASLADAKEIQKIAEEKNLPVFSSSSLRFVPELQGILANPEEYGDIKQVHVFAPGHLEPTNPGLYWYGVHGVEMVYTLLGPGCREVVCHTSENGDIVVAKWENGKIATLAATRLPRSDYGGAVHSEKKVSAFVCDTRDLYVPLVKSIVAFFKGAKPPVPIATTVEMMAFIEGALKSQGQPVPLEV